MEKELIKLGEIIQKKVPTIVEAIENEEPTSEKYGKLLSNFNSSMVVYSQIVTTLATAQTPEEQVKEEN